MCYLNVHATQFSWKNTSPEERAEGMSRQARKKISFPGFFSLFLSITLIFAAILWYIYYSLPHEDYLPVSFGALVVVGLIAYIFLNKRLAIS